MTEKTEALRLADALKAATEQTDAEDDVIHVARWFVEDAAAELRRLSAENDRLQARYEACRIAAHQWLDKTEWIQETGRDCELGMHRADAVRQRLSAIEAQRDALLEALRAIVHAATVHACHHALSVDGQQFYDIARAAIKAVEEGK